MAKLAGAGLKVTLAALAAVPVLLALGVLGAIELRAKRFTEPLVADAIRVASFSRSRVRLQQGSAGECLARALDTAPDVSRDVPWSTPTIHDVIVGTKPLTDLPGTALDSMARNDPWLRSTVACTRLPLLEPVDGVGPLAVLAHPRRQALPKLQETAGTLTPLRVRVLVEHGAFAEAMELCADALGLASDELWLEGHEASLGGLGQANRLVQPCADAVWRSRDEALVRELKDRLALLAREAPPYSHVMELERVAQSLSVFGGFMSAEQRGRLPAGAEAMVVTASRPRPLLERLALAAWWPSADRAFRGLVTVADAPVVDRTRLMVAARGDFESPWMRVFGGMPLDVRYELYAESHDALATAIEFLQVTAALKLNEVPVMNFVELRRVGEVVKLTPKAGRWVHVEVELR